MKVKITTPQLIAIEEIVEELESSIGVAEDDSERIKWIRLAKRFIKNAKDNY